MLSGLTLGIVGYGDIGCECARVAKHGFNMRVLAVKRDPSKCNEKQRSTADEIFPSDEQGLNKLLSQSDFVVNVMPSTPETEGFFNMQKFSQMKPTGIFMNIGRGKSVVEEDLIKALEEKVIGGAYLDVYATEPFPADSPLWGFDNVYMTPHCADWTWNILELSI